MKANWPSLLIVGIVMTMFISCGKKSDKPTPAPPTDSTGTSGGGSGPKVTDVYVAGSDNGKPCYWKNDTEVILPATQAGEAFSISVNSTGVYVVGEVNSKAAYWNNGVEMSLQPKTTQGIPATGEYIARSGCLSDSDYYVVIDQPVLSYNYTKMDNYLKIQPSGFSTEYGIPDQENGGTANSIAVSGTDVYIAGYGVKGQYQINGVTIEEPFACIWKNGSESGLSSPPGFDPGADFIYGLAMGVAVSGTDVYAAGELSYGQFGVLQQSYPPQAIYWKNNVAQVLPGSNGPVVGVATAITLSGSDVYIAGNADYSDSYYSPVFWKNGVMTELPDEDATTTSIAVSPGGDVYITANLYTKESGDDGYTAIFWKNGSQTTLGSAATSSANAVFLYTH